MMKTTSSFPLDRIDTLGQAAGAWLDAQRTAGLSESTLLSRANAIRRFEEAWGDRDVREVTRADLEAWAKVVTARVSRETSYLYLAGVRALFRFLTERHVLLVDPAAGIPLPTMGRRVTGPTLSKAEMKRLVESTEHPRDRALLEFLYSTGLRASEVRRLKLQDLGEDAVVVRGGKGAKDRVVPVGANAMIWVKRYVATRRSKLDALWLTDTGREFGMARFFQVLRGLGKAAGLAVNCHTIRRSLATHLLAAGASPSEVAAMLGHEDLKSLSRYAAVVDGEVRATHASTHPREVGGE